MNRNRNNLIVKWPMPALMAVAFAVTTFGANLPNVVMIMADDWGWSDITAYREYQANVMGHDLGSLGGTNAIPTPNLDRLCAAGLMFTDAHSPAALCAPTRFSMMTGSNPYRNGVQWGTWGFEKTSAFSVNRNHITVGEIARSAGYRTAFFGKMHFGGGSTNFDEMMPNFPTTYGFDYVFSSHDGIQADPYLYFENDRFVRIDPADPLNPSIPGSNADTAWMVAGNFTNANGIGIIKAGKEGIGDPYWDVSQNGIINSRKATAFIGDHLANHPDKPFMMYYCSPQVHAPHSPPIDFEPNTDGTPGSPPNVPVAGTTGGDELADMVYELDLQVGWILNNLEDPNGDGNTSDSILTNTLVMFTSDNGGLASDRGLPGYDSTGILSGSKSMIEEGGHRVPFIAMWGDGNPATTNDTIAPGTVSDQLICGHDWVGIMYALTGQSMVSNQAMDCANILPILLGEQDEAVPVHDFMIHQSQNKKVYPYALRQGDYVMFFDQSKGGGPIYNLATDLTQTNNLLAGVPLPEDITRSNQMHTLFLQHDEADDLRTTIAYSAPDTYPPLPDPAEFNTTPVALGPTIVTMTATSGSEVSGPVEYLFSEISGNAGGASSDWQTSPTYVNSNLLPGTTYAYTVTMRDALGHTGSASPAQEITLGYQVNLYSDDFETTVDAGNVTNAPYPTEQWHLQDATGTKPHWTRDEQIAGNSVNVSDFNSDSDNELRLGFGFDEVVVLYSTSATFEPGRDYTLSGTWEVDVAFTNNHLGFIAGFAEFSGTDGALVQRLTPDTAILGNTNSPTAGDTGLFNLTLTAAEWEASGASTNNLIGLFFHHDDDGVLYSDHAVGSTNKNETYLIDDVQLGFNTKITFGQWTSSYGISNAVVDLDGDGLNNLYEFGLGGNPTNATLTGYPSVMITDPSGVRYIHPKRKNSALNYYLETSTNLISGNWTNTGYTVLPDEGSLANDFDAVTNSLLTDNDQTFIRLIIEEQ